MATASEYTRIVEVEANTGGPTGFAMRAGRAWPVGSPVQVEVLDQDEDPPALEQPGDKVWVDGVMRPPTRPDLARIGRTTLAQLKADSRLSVIE
jgi:hypothetical protein